MLAVFLDLTDRLVLVVGGGAVGRRKARAVLDAGGSVLLVCLEARPDDAGDIDWRQEAYQERHLDGVSLVFAAATAKVNACVVGDARRHGLWVNAADGTGDFDLAATVRRGELIVAVGTGGAAPSLARRLRERMEEQFDESYGKWVRLLAELRHEVQAAIIDESRRREMFERLTEWGWLERIRAEGVEAVREAMRRCLAEGGG